MHTELARIRRYLRTQEIHVRWLGDQSGYTLPDLEEIHVNPTWEIARVLVHEALHHLYPDWDEHRVEAETIMLVDEMTPKQARGLAQRCQGITWTQTGGTR